MSIRADGRMVTNVCCHSNGYSSATKAQMHELIVLKKEKYENLLTIFSMR